MLKLTPPPKANTCRIGLAILHHERVSKCLPSLGVCVRYMGAHAHAHVCVCRMCLCVRVRSCVCVCVRVCAGVTRPATAFPPLLPFPPPLSFSPFLLPFLSSLSFSPFLLPVPSSLSFFPFLLPFPSPLSYSPAPSCIYLLPGVVMVPSCTLLRPRSAGGANWLGLLQCARLE